MAIRQGPDNHIPTPDNLEMDGNSPGHNSLDDQNRRTLSKQDSNRQDRPNNHSKPDNHIPDNHIPANHIPAKPTNNSLMDPQICHSTALRPDTHNHPPASSGKFPTCSTADTTARS